MNVSYKWLKEYIDFTLTPQEVCDALTSTGLEVDALTEVQTIKGGLKGLYVGKVLTCEPHPNSDHLHVTTVDLGHDAPSQIVCGAPNVAAGKKVIVADLGCVLYDGDKEFQIKKSKLRGVESSGMICAEDEIGVGTSHDGIIVLPDDAPVGQPAAQYYNVESDWLIEIDITANRADALSHWGVARDLYAYLRRHGIETSLHRPDCGKWSVDSHELPIAVEIENEDACLRYACVSLTGCEVKESPEWLQNHLRTIGLRPINNIVDITNYIMMAYGQPMHCFDADMVDGHKIVVRTQPEGTPFVTLDGEEHKLGEHDLSICNATAPMCIAGIFGGKGSGTYETTTNIVLESAQFHPTWIRKSARRHGLSTDASFRFERGIDPDGLIYALKQAAILCRELAGGKIAMDVCDVYPHPAEKTRVHLEYDYVNNLVGKRLAPEEIKAICQSLEMNIETETAEALDIVVPAYRVDVKRPCDVVEDILRIYGYNNVEMPTQLKGSLVVKGEDDRKHKLQNIISEQLCGCGFNEILNNSLTRSAYYDGFEAFDPASLVKIFNPLSSDLNVMRGSLLFGGLESLCHNIKHRAANLSFFEFGNVYKYTAAKWNAENPMAAYAEDRHLGLWLTGKRVEGSWAHPDEQTTYHEMAAYVYNVFSRVGAVGGNYVSKPYKSDIYAAAMEITDRAGHVLATMGQLSRKVLKPFDVEQPVFYADIDWTALMKSTRKVAVKYAEISRYPAVSRDLALLVDKDLPFSAIEETARQTERKLLRKVELFDVYEGKNLPEGKKSYAVNFTLQDDSKTMSDKQIDAVMTKLITNIKNKLGAELR